MEEKRRRFWVIAITLFVLSSLYDVLIIRRLARENKMEKWTWLTVVVGVAYTLAGVWLVDRQAAKTVFLLFCFSGTPMSIGDLVRWWVREQNGRQRLAAIQAKVKHDGHHVRSG